MTPDSEEELELLRALDAYDALIAQCVHGELSYREFEQRYGAPYPGYPLDGHESHPPRALLEKHAQRIALHRDIYEEVLTRVVGTEYASYVGTIGPSGHAFINETEAVRRLGILLVRHRRHSVR